jgi:biopolymer transport protein ExbD
LHFREVYVKILKNKIVGFEDSNDTALVASEEMKFDHIIKIMDVSKNAEFTNVSLENI